MTARTRVLTLAAPLALLLAWAGAPTFSQDKPNKDAPAATKYEYRTVQFYESKGGDMDKSFNALGDQGWEMVTSNTAPAPSGVTVANYVFKRPKR